MRRGLVEEAGIAVILDDGGRAAMVGFRSPQRVVRDDQVQQAVVVVIEPGRADAERSRRLGADSGYLGHVRKRAVPVVVIEGVPPSATNEDVFVTVVVVIADGDAKVVAEILAGKPSFLRNVLECAVASVAQQAVIKGWAGLLQLGQLRAIGEEDVHLAVVVEIEDRDAAGHRLRKVLTRGKVVIGVVREFRTWVDIGEVRPRRGGLRRLKRAKPKQSCDRGGGLHAPGGFNEGGFSRGLREWFSAASLGYV